MQLSCQRWGSQLPCHRSVCETYRLTSDAAQGWRKSLGAKGAFLASTGALKSSVRLGAGVLAPLLCTLAGHCATAFAANPGGAGASSAPVVTRAASPAGSIAPRRSSPSAHVTDRKSVV